MFGWFKKRSKHSSPDFSDINSREKAEELLRRGELEVLYLQPLDLGGQDHPLNTLYVPVGTAAIKASTDNNVIVPLAEEGKITKYKAVPEYHGDSIIPIAITIIASDPGEFTMTINIWGDALNREQAS
jgi:hypothetical protein